MSFHIKTMHDNNNTISNGCIAYQNTKELFQIKQSSNLINNLIGHNTDASHTLNDTITQWYVPIGYKLILYENGNYNSTTSGTVTTIDNTNGSTNRFVSNSDLNSTSSLKLYFNDTQIPEITSSPPTIAVTMTS